MNGKLKENMILLDAMIAQLKVYMNNLEKKGMETDPLYLDFKRQSERMQNTLGLLRLLPRQSKRRKSQ